MPLSFQILRFAPIIELGWLTLDWELFPPKTSERYPPSLNRKSWRQYCTAFRLHRTTTKDPSNTRLFTAGRKEEAKDILYCSQKGYLLSCKVVKHPSITTSIFEVETERTRSNGQLRQKQQNSIKYNYNDVLSNCITV